jgi:hypothetical protein
MEEVVRDLNEVKFISVLVHGSNHVGLKLVPVLIRYLSNIWLSTRKKVQVK